MVNSFEAGISVIYSKLPQSVVFLKYFISTLKFLFGIVKADVVECSILNMVWWKVGFLLFRKKLIFYLNILVLWAMPILCFYWFAYIFGDVRVCVHACLYAEHLQVWISLLVLEQDGLFSRFHYIGQSLRYITRVIFFLVFQIFSYILPESDFNRSIKSWLVLQTRSEAVDIKKGDKN